LRAGCDILALTVFATKQARHSEQAAFGGADPEFIEGRFALRWIPGQAWNGGVVWPQDWDRLKSNAVPPCRQGQTAEFA
jgi:hypothetical protein